MVDVVDPARRSRMMSGIRAKNTRPEIFIRKGLHALGFRFRIHAAAIPGKPDIVLPKYHALIVVHGCFWHAHDCHHFKLPATNTAFWKNKLDENCQRDRRNLKLQLAAGWRCLTVWECAIRACRRGPRKLDVITLAAQWLAGDTVAGTIDEQGLKEQSVA